MIRPWIVAVGALAALWVRSDPVPATGLRVRAQADPADPLAGEIAAAYEEGLR